jgi:hypothetical protein
VENKAGQAKETFEDFKKSIGLNNYLHRYQIRTIDEYVEMRIKKRDWRFCREWTESFLKRLDPRSFFAALYEVCRKKLEYNFDTGDERTIHRNKLRFLESLEIISKHLKSLNTRESGLSGEELINFKRYLKRILENQKKYYRRKDGTPIVHQKVVLSFESNPDASTVVEVTTKPELVLLLLLLNSLKEKTNPSNSHRRSVAKYFLFWDFESQGKDYKENLPQQFECLNDILIADLADRFKERYKDALPFKILGFYDPSEERFRVIIEKGKRGESSV